MPPVVCSGPHARITRFTPQGNVVPELERNLTTALGGTPAEVTAITWALLADIGTRIKDAKVAKLTSS